MHQETMSLYSDITSAINILKNPNQHSQKKDIGIWLHFIRELVEEGTIVLEYNPTKRRLIF